MITVLEFPLEISGKFSFVRTWHTYETWRMLKNKMGIFSLGLFWVVIVIIL